MPGMGPLRVHQPHACQRVVKTPTIDRKALEAFVLAGLRMMNLEMAAEP